MATNSVKIGLELAIGQAKTALESFFGGFKKQVAEADKTVAKLNKTTAGLETVLKRLAPFLGVAAFTSLAKSAIDTADSFDELSQKTGFAVESLAGIVNLAKIEGKSIDDLSGVLSKFSKTINDAANGNDAAAETLVRLGVAITDEAGKLRGLDVILEDTMEQFAGMADGIQKSALAVDLFGKSGANLIPFLNQGAEGLRRARDEARAFGNEIDSNTAKRAGNLNDNITRLKQALMGLFQALTTAILPALETLSNSFVEIAKNGNGFTSIIGTIASIFNGLVAVGYTLTGVLASIGDGFIGLSSALVKLVMGDLRGARNELLQTADILEARYEETFNRLAGVFGLSPMAPRASGGMVQDTDPTTGTQERAQKEVEARIKAQKDAEEKLIASAKALGDARAEAEAQAFTARLETETQKLDADYQSGLIGLEKYHAERLRITKETLDEELKLLNKQLDAANDARRAAGQMGGNEGGTARNIAEAQQQKAIADIMRLAERRKQVEIKAEQDLIAARKQIQDAAATQELARNRAAQSRFENDPTLLRLERTRQLLPLLERELELLKQQEVQALNLRRAAGSPADQIAAEQQLLDIEQRRADIRNQQRDLQQPFSFNESLMAQMTEFANSIQTTAENLAAILVAPFEAMRQSASQAFADIIKGNMTAGEAMRTVWNSIVNSIIDSFAQMVTDWIMTHVIMKGVALAYKAFTSGMRKADVAEANATEASKTPALAANATLASIGSWGVAVAIGIAAIAGILASVGAFEQGGVVGGGEQLIRVNENGTESVLNARATRNLGTALIDRINSGMVTAGDFSNMGLSAFESMANGIGDAQAPMGSAGAGGETPLAITVIVLDNRFPERVYDAMRSATGRVIIVDTASANQPEVGIDG